MQKAIDIGIFLIAIAATYFVWQAVFLYPVYACIRIYAQWHELRPRHLDKKEMDLLLELESRVGRVEFDQRM